MYMLACMLDLCVCCEEWPVVLNVTCLEFILFFFRCSSNKPSHKKRTWWWTEKKPLLKKEILSISVQWILFSKLLVTKCFMLIQGFGFEVAYNFAVLNVHYRNFLQFFVIFCYYEYCSQDESQLIILAIVHKFHRYFVRILL